MVNKIETQKEKCLKAAKNRDYTFIQNSNENRKCIKAINQKTEEVTCYRSTYAAQQNLIVNAGIIKMVCENLNYCKTGLS